MIRYSAIYVVVSLMFLGTSGFAAGNPWPEEKIKAFIKALASPDNGEHAYVILRQNIGFRAFPYLLDSLDDERYSFTAWEDSRRVDWSVGRACFEIIRDHLEPRWKRSGPPRAPRPSYSEHCNLNKRAQAKAWWEIRKQKSLRELQIEALEWVVGEEARVPEKYPERDRKYLQAVLAGLRAGDAPLELFHKMPR
ncbi:MAG: hypothetical protein ABSG68_05440 [Thermoguttaceae bacterium]|jgi:hypothetical protein